MQPFGVYQTTEREGVNALTRLPFRLAAQVAAGAEATITREVPKDGTIESLRVRIYKGAELALQIVPYVEDENGKRRNLVAFAPGGKQYIDGDDDTFVYIIREPVSKRAGDALKVYAKNTGAFAYDFAVDIEIDFAGGMWPIQVIAAQGGLTPNGG